MKAHIDHTWLRSDHVLFMLFVFSYVDVYFSVHPIFGGIRVAHHCSVVFLLYLSSFCVLCPLFVRIAHSGMLFVFLYSLLTIHCHGYLPLL